MQCQSLTNPLYEMAIQYQSTNPWPIHQPNANLGTNHPSTYPRPISKTMTNLWPICQCLVNHTNQYLYSENLKSVGPIYQLIINRLSILGQSISNVTIQSQSLSNPSVQRQGPHPNHQTNLSVPLIKTWSVRIGTESSANSGLIIQSVPNLQSSNSLPILDQSTNPFQKYLINNAIWDGGVAPHHCLRLNWVTSRDLKGKKEC